MSLTTKVAGKSLTTKEEDIKQAVSIKDAFDDHLGKGDHEVVKAFVEEIGYDIVWKS